MQTKLNMPPKATGRLQRASNRVIRQRVNCWALIRRTPKQRSRYACSALGTAGCNWSRTPMQERIAFLTRLAELLEERVETYGRLITAEMGKPLADSIFEIKKSAWAARHLA